MKCENKSNPQEKVEPFISNKNLQEGELNVSN